MNQYLTGRGHSGNPFTIPVIEKTAAFNRIKQNKGEWSHELAPPKRK
jgi:hypothetical protein